MTFLESLQLSVFGLGTVFTILIALSVIITIESKLFGFFAKNKTVGKPTEHKIKPVNAAPAANITAGELKLIEVDEKTAALIMAIVSDESQIPVSELNFKYIKAID